MKNLIIHIWSVVLVQTFHPPWGFYVACQTIHPVYFILDYSNKLRSQRKAKSVMPYLFNKNNFFAFLAQVQCLARNVEIFLYSKLNINLIFTFFFPGPFIHYPKRLKKDIKYTSHIYWTRIRINSISSNTAKCFSTFPTCEWKRRKKYPRETFLYSIWVVSH